MSEIVYLLTMKVNGFDLVHLYTTSTIILAKWTPWSINMWIRKEGVRSKD
jgi:hypothetical protein